MYHKFHNYFKHICNYCRTEARPLPQFIHSCTLFMLLLYLSVESAAHRHASWSNTRNLKGKHQTFSASLTSKSTANHNNRLFLYSPNLQYQSHRSLPLRGYMLRPAEDYGKNATKRRRVPFSKSKESFAVFLLEPTIRM